METLRRVLAARLECAAERGRAQRLRRQAATLLSAAEEARLTVSGFPGWLSWMVPRSVPVAPSSAGGRRTGRSSHAPPAVNT